MAYAINKMPQTEGLGAGIRGHVRTGLRIRGRDPAAIPLHGGAWPDRPLPAPVTGTGTAARK